MAALTAKQEAFAQAVASGKNHSDAYRAVYRVRPTTKAESVNQAASRVMNNVNVTARVKELREKVSDKTKITLEKHLDDLMTLRNLAAKEGNYGAAISAEIARGRASGVIAPTVTQTSVKVEPQELTPEELRQELEKRGLPTSFLSE